MSKVTKEVTVTLDDITGREMAEDSGWTLTRRSDGAEIHFGYIPFGLAAIALVDVMYAVNGNVPDETQE